MAHRCGKAEGRVQFSGGPLRERNTGGSSNGKTPDLQSGDRGSTPRPVHSGVIMNSTISRNQRTSVARTVYPEDLKCGDYVAVLNVIEEFPSFLWSCDSAATEIDQLVRLRFRSTGEGLPLRIEAVCLPFVLVISPRSRSQTLDVRQVELVCVTKRYAKVVWKRLKKKKNGR